MADLTTEPLLAMSPMAPIPTGVAPSIPPLHGVKAVLFDLYGTLLVSAAGGQSSDRRKNGIAAMGEVLLELVQQGWLSAIAEGDEARWLQRYEDILERRRQERARCGVDFPEVDIREVWSELLEAAKLPAAPAAPDGTGKWIEALALRFECAVNPCWGMPGAAPLLEGLARDGKAIGLISNAQFYTAAVFETATGLPLEGGLFASDLSFFSYREDRGKPSPALFELARNALELRGIAPSETLYLGNDMIKDVLPAKATGFRAALFAGDARSLRLGPGGVPEANRRADLVVTELAQIAQALATGE